MTSTAESKRAFVLGGGGIQGAAEVGMLLALAEADLRPDLILGTSIGAINGALFAADPTRDGAGRLERFWRELGSESVFGSGLLEQVRTLARGRTHLHGNERLRRTLTAALPARFSELEVRFECVAASIERSAAHWFSEGPLIESLLASSAVPGLLPAVEIEGEHYLDGGLVHSIPVGRAVELGAQEIYVLHVGRVDSPLAAPRNPLQVGLVAFEISRRHRFIGEMERLPEGIEVRVLPTGSEGPRFNDSSQLRYWDVAAVGDRIEAAREATSALLEDLA
ncbi:MAG: patatin-like phospholipase family protein [Thermoleophilia bacterium]|nr:patatin-like phospholipase family protein [Thermoleophilia bacterium]